MGWALFACVQAPRALDASAEAVPDPVDSGPEPIDFGVLDAGPLDAAASPDFSGMDLGLPDAACGKWEAVEPAPEGWGRTSAHGVWTGHEVMIWGRRSAPPEAPQAVAYDPARGTWRALPTTPRVPEANPFWSCIVWTGTELFVMGPHPKAPGSDIQAAAASFDPSTDTWSPVSVPEDFQVRANGVCEWTGSEVWIWGGTRESEVFYDGLAFDPRMSTWRRLPEAEGLRTSSHTGVWTGAGLLVGGWNHSGREGTYALYGAGGERPVAVDLPRTIDDDVGSVQYAMVAAEGGSLLYGGWSGGDEYVARVLRFDVHGDADRWTRYPDPPVTPGGNHATAWTGSEFLVFGGTPAPFRLGPREPEGAAFDPDQGRWRPLDVDGAPTALEKFTAVWIDDGWFVWGGHASAKTYQGTGAIYRPCETSP